MKVNDARTSLDAVLQGAGWADPLERRSIGLYLLEDLLGLDRTHLLLTDKDRLLTLSEQDRFKKQLARLSAREPVQYIVGSVEFCGLKIAVAPGVLIPRPETEELVALVKKRERDMQVNSFMDVCTGSACIALALEKSFLHARAYAFDFSEAALAVARRNLIHNHSKIELFKANALDEGTYSSKLSGKLDFIVSNPPYVLPAEECQMEPHVLEYEPRDALFAPADNPLLFYQAITEFAARHLVPNGRLYFEVNASLAEDTRRLVSQILSTEAELVKDVFGRSRFVAATQVSQ